MAKRGYWRRRTPRRRYSVLVPAAAAGDSETHMLDWIIAIVGMAAVAWIVWRLLERQEKESD